MKSTLIILLLICFHFTVTAQESIPVDLAKARISFEKKDYTDAISYYKRCLQRKSKKHKQYYGEAFQRLGECYRIMNDNEQAIYFYQKSILEYNASNETVLNYARVLKKTAKYTEAKLQFKKLLVVYPDSTLFQGYVASCDSAIQWSSESSQYKVSLVEKINSEYSDITAVPFKDGLVFSSNRESIIIKRKSGESNEPYYNLYIAKTDSLDRVKGISLFSASINSRQHETAPNFNKDFSMVYYTSNQLDKDRVSRPKLYSASHNKGSWKSKERFVLNDSTYSFAHPSIDSSSKMFFFSSDMPGGFGGMDLYVCFNIDSSWSSPINLGAVVNTSGNELYPFYHGSGTLYFSSDGHVSIGGYDMYEAVQKNGDWINVQNLKAPINSSSDDFAIYFDADKKKGYFSSNRPGGLGSEDIYNIELK